VNSAAKTDIGKHRDSNQDDFLIMQNDNYHLYALCDGMGGLKGGKLAATTCLKIIKQEFLKLDKQLNKFEIQKWLYESIIKANEKIFALGDFDITLRGMGTTLIVLLLSKEYKVFASVGDSRLYHYDVNTLNQLSEDQTYVAALLRAGYINKKQAENHPRKSMLLSAVGSGENEELDIQIEFIEKEGNFLICSDGLYNMVSDDEIFNELNVNVSINKKVDNLIELANKNGGYDNITLILIEGVK
jgi:protein phosphatase